MPANTPRGLPYPLPTEPVAEGAQAIRNLAEALDPKVAQLIANNTLVANSGSAADFTAIPQTFAHLLVICQVRTEIPAVLHGLGMRFNNDATASYDWQQLQATGTAVTAANFSSQTMGVVGYVAGLNESADYFAATRILIPDYRGAKAKQYQAESSKISPLTAQAQNTWGVWRSASAINRITILPNGGYNCVPGSRVTLYGLP